MKSLLNEIYENIITNEEDVIKMNCKLDAEIQNIVKESQNDSVDMQDVYFDIAFLAQRQGFKLGVKYALKLLLELQSD